MADSDIQSVLAARRGRVPVLPPAPAGGYDSNTMPSDSSVYTLNNREKTGNIQHTAEEMAKIAADMQAKEAGRRQTGGADTHLLKHCAEVLLPLWWGSHWLTLLGLTLLGLPAGLRLK